MKIFSTPDELRSTLGLKPDEDVLSLEKVRGIAADLIATFVLAENEDVKHTTETVIKNSAEANGIFPASIYDLYTKIGLLEIPQNFTIPAINIRTLTFDTAVVVFRLMQKHNIGPVIFEIAKSEMGYTEQRPNEYATAVLAAALTAGHRGPVFIQGDHFQLNAESFQKDPQREIENIEKLIAEAVNAKFLQIDIDASTLVDLKKEKLTDQQRNNFEVTSRLTQAIRKLEPENVTISIGGEIGHIGGKNSTVEEFQAFMQGYSQKVVGNGISKVSVQTGSSHGGIPLPDGTIQKVSLDFTVLESIGKAAKSDYKLAGAVQHGASTLPLELFDKFPKNNTVEIHLATGFQNTVYDNLPKQLNEEISAWVEKSLTKEWSEDLSKEQFLYKSRKKAFGPFKKTLWMMRDSEKEPILRALDNQFEEIFAKLNIFNTQDLLVRYVK